MRAISVLSLILAGALSEIVQSPRWTTNSMSTAKRGRDFYLAGDFAKAAEMFEISSRISDTPSAAFNSGTAEIAKKNYAKGSEMISRAATEPVLRPDVFYNRGNSALGANAFEYAIRDYTAALKLRPNDQDAKRNLEIALRRKEKADQPPESPQQQQSRPAEPQNSTDQPSEKVEDGSAESLLRSVAQQEREELKRMRRSQPEPEKIGW